MENEPLARLILPFIFALCAAGDAKADRDPLSSRQFQYKDYLIEEAYLDGIPMERMQKLIDEANIQRDSLNPSERTSLVLLDSDYLRTLKSRIPDLEKSWARLNHFRKNFSQEEAPRFVRYARWRSAGHEFVGALLLELLLRNDSREAIWQTDFGELIKSPQARELIASFEGISLDNGADGRSFDLEVKGFELSLFYQEVIQHFRGINLNEEWHGDFRKALNKSSKILVQDLEVLDRLRSALMESTRSESFRRYLSRDHSVESYKNLQALSDYLLSRTSGRVLLDQNPFYADLSNLKRLQRSSQRDYWLAKWLYGYRDYREGMLTASWLNVGSIHGHSRVLEADFENTQYMNLFFSLNPRSADLIDVEWRQNSDSLAFTDLKTGLAHFFPMSEITERYGLLGDEIELTRKCREIFQKFD